MVNNSLSDSPLLQHAAHERNFIKNIIVPAYQKERNDFFQLSEKFWNFKKNEVLEKDEQVQLNEIRKETNQRKSRLLFFYEDFFIHAVILLDLIAQILSENECKTFPDLVERIKKNLDSKIAKQILDFNPQASKIRYWRNKLIVHKEIVQFWGGSIRYSPKKESIEFMIDNRDNLITNEEMSFAYQIRDKYQEKFSKLRGEQNFFELLSLFNELEVPLCRSEIKKMFEITKRCGGFTPNLEIFFEPFNEFIEKLAVLETVNN